MSATSSSGTKVMGGWSKERSYKIEEVKTAGATFINQDGVRLRLEERNDKEVAVVGWTTHESTSKIARKLGQLARQEDEAHVLTIEPDRRRRLQDARKLWNVVAQMSRVELIRLDRTETSFVWERSTLQSSSGVMPELTILTHSWLEAEQQAIALGAPLEYGEIEKLIEEI